MINTGEGNIEHGGIQKSYMGEKSEHKGLREVEIRENWQMMEKWEMVSRTGSAEDVMDVEKVLIVESALVQVSTAVESILVG